MGLGVMVQFQHDRSAKDGEREPVATGTGNWGHSGAREPGVEREECAEFEGRRGDGREDGSDAG